MKALEQRITGTEMEYPVMAQRTEDGTLQKVEYRHVYEKLLREHLPDELVRYPESGMMSNGSRLYVDLESFLEYATPEDTSFKGTVANEIAGERIVLSILDSAQAAGDIAAYAVNKRVVSDDLNTWGYHTSFAVNAAKLGVHSISMHPIGMHLATQNIYAGAGALYNNQHGKQSYAIAQKVLNLTCDENTSSHTPSAQPLLSLRNESHANMHIGRLHLTSMDANISPWATWMRLGTTSIVARLVENGYQHGKDDDIKLNDTPMYRLAISVAHDPDLKRSFKLHRGEYARAVDIQRTLYNHAALLDLPAQEQEVMIEWKKALDDIEEDPNLLVDRADWVIRKRIIERGLAKKGLGMDSPVARLYDKSYDYLDSQSIDAAGGSRSIGLRLRGRGVLRSFMPNDDEIITAMASPPQTTRAKVRGEYIRDHPDSPFPHVDWSVIKPAFKPKDNIRLSNPYQTE